jgi:hypothetical protein
MVKYPIVVARAKDKKATNIKTGQFYGVVVVTECSR